MDEVLENLIRTLGDPVIEETSVISWGAPIPAFGDPNRAKVATLGINPSNREFVDKSGKELDGLSRRFHTLTSLELECWGDVDVRHLEMISATCRNYFTNNPYDGWFRQLDSIICGTNASYYGGAASACHLDLIPFATAEKWTSLTNGQRNKLLLLGRKTLGKMLSESPISVLILNGQSVVSQFEQMAETTLTTRKMPSWMLNRKSGKGVQGIAYKGRINRFGGVCTKGEILVLGYNHNIQSSFGVTNKVREAIQYWIGQNMEGRDL